MNVWGLPMSCPSCGDSFEHVNGTANELLVVEIVECVSCRTQFEVTTRMRPFGRQSGRRWNASWLSREAS